MPVLQGSNGGADAIGGILGTVFSALAAQQQAKNNKAALDAKQKQQATANAIARQLILSTQQTYLPQALSPQAA